MTAPLRRAHRWIWVAVAVANFAVLVAALASRRDSTPHNPQVHWEHFR